MVDLVSECPAAGGCGRADRWPRATSRTGRSIVSGIPSWRPDDVRDPAIHQTRLASNN